MNKIFLNLLSYPLFFAPLISLFVSANVVHAKELVFQPQVNDEASSCQNYAPANNLVCIRLQANDSGNSIHNLAQNNNEDMMLQFTEEESEAAIALYGCDCIACVNALRAMRGLPPIGS